MNLDGDEETSTEEFEFDPHKDDILKNYMEPEVEEDTLLDRASLKTLKRKAKNKEELGLIVETEEGPVRGVSIGATRVFLGVPYSGAPVGEYRWRRAPPAAKRSFVFDASTHGNHCHQLLSTPSTRLRDLFMKNQGTASEDCLNLDVYAPSMDRLLSGQKKGGELALVPVIVFVHGGCFSNGSNSAPVHNPSDFVQSMKAILVVPNYRLNVAGFLASEEFALEARKVYAMLCVCRRDSDPLVIGASGTSLMR